MRARVLLDAWIPRNPGPLLDYPGRRQVPADLRTIIAVLEDSQRKGATSLPESRERANLDSMRLSRAICFSCPLARFGSRVASARMQYTQS
jgi:hypothetical protein